MIGRYIGILQTFARMHILLRSLNAFFNSSSGKLAHNRADILENCITAQQPTTDASFWENSIQNFMGKTRIQIGLSYANNDNQLKMQFHVKREHTQPSEHFYKLQALRVARVHLSAIHVRNTEDIQDGHLRANYTGLSSFWSTIDSPG